jgi:hypothetical protein
MKKMINSEKIEGRLYTHNLTIKQVQNKESKNYGTDFISGTVDIATDEELLNVIQVHFTYVTETTSSGKVNQTYVNLKKIIEGAKTVVSDGPEEAMKLKIDTALALNDFYNNNGDLVSTKVNEGGFVTILNGELSPEEERNTFTVDMLITSVIRTEADPEKNIEKDYLTVKGAIFNFRNNLLPVDFKVTNEQGMEYFESLDASQSNPVFTKLWGKIKSANIVNEVKEDTAFGEAAVRTYTKKVKEWVITGSAKEPYDFGDESVLTADELTKAMQDRELLLADTKKRNEEYKNNKSTENKQPVAAPAKQVVTQTFNF